MKTIEEILLSRNELDRIYLGHLTLPLWRAIKAPSSKGNVLHPELQERVMSRGRIRPADVGMYENQGQQWVKSTLGRGVSLLDRPNAFPGPDWEYFVIPAGTEIPSGLIITKDHFIERYNATHYSISPNHDMPLADYIRLLDELARNASTHIKESSNG